MEIKELPSKGSNGIRSTIVGNVWVSTILRPDELKYLDEVLGMFDEVLDRPAQLKQVGDYETLVFNCDPEGEVTDWMELDFARYSSEEAAREGHAKMVEKWSKK